jgi:CPA1 family monovalent cation:H+ antiporter
VADAIASAAVVAAVVLTGISLSRVFDRSGTSTMVLISVAGVAIGALVPSRLVPPLGPAFLALFLPALIFEAAWDADAAALRRAALAIAMLAGPGVLVTAALVGCAAAASGALGWPAAFVLGAIVSATDPVSVLATFRRLALPHVLLTIVEGESVANDGVALALVQSLVPLAIPAAVHLSVPAVVTQMLAVAGGGVLAGTILAVPAGLAMRAPLGLALNVALTVAVAYASYAAAAAIGVSGIFAVAAAGITLRTLARIPADGPMALSVDRAWDATAFVCNAVVFALVGLSLRLDRLVHEPLLIVYVLAAVVGARLVLAYALVPLRGLTDAPGQWRSAIALAGLRGGLSLVLAIGLPAALGSRDVIRDAVFGVVFATLILQGPLIGPLLRRVLPAPYSNATSAGARGIGRPSRSLEEPNWTTSSS